VPVAAEELAHEGAGADVGDARVLLRVKHAGPFFTP
jgi:hypothetical protein